jgi:hypothetical protein
MENGWLEEILEQLLDDALPQAVRRGLQLCKQGELEILDVDEENCIAKVTDHVVMYNVNLDLTFFSMSRCDCGSGTWCHHIAAAVFHLYATEAAGSYKMTLDELADRVEQHLTGWEQEERRTQRKKPLAAHRQNNHIDPPGKLMEKPVPAKTSVKEWRDFFSAQMALFESRMGSTQLGSGFGINAIVNRSGIESFYSTISKMFTSSALADHLCRFTLHLFTIDYLLKNIDSTFAGYGLRSFGDYLDELMDRAMEMMQAIAAHPDFAPDNVQLQALLPYMEEVLLRDDGAGSAYRFNMYALFYLIVLNRPEDQAEATARLKRRIADTRRTASIEERSRSTLTTFALVHHAFVQGNDDQALKMLCENQPTSLIYASFWLQLLTQANEWTRMRVWLDRLTDAVEEHKQLYNSFQLDDFLYDWTQYAEATGQETAMRSVLERLMPLSRQFYEVYLYDNKQYRDWVTLQVVKRFDVTDFDKETLKEIENEDLPALLPLYHQSVALWIEQKNRGAYKNAVRLLKKLRTYYKKLNQPERWEWYIGHLQSRYSRLRALQEEMRKGKLIS